MCFRWNGADTNPQNNDGQGKKGSDRNNVLLLRDRNYPEGNSLQYGPAPTYGQYGNNYPANISDSQFLGFNEKDLLKLAFLDPGKGRKLFLRRPVTHFLIELIKVHRYITTKISSLTWKWLFIMFKMVWRYSAFLLPSKVLSFFKECLLMINIEG